MKASGQDGGAQTKVNKTTTQKDSRKDNTKSKAKEIKASSRTRKQKVDEQNTEHNSPLCQSCCGQVGEDVCALNCNRCGDETAWKCMNCLDISEEIYKVLKSTTALQWFCEDCIGKCL